MNKLHFGYIAPICYLNMIPEDQTFHLVLTHYLKDPTYLAFYKKKQERGDTIVADNMAFELKRSISADELIQTIDQSGLKPTYVVAPDYPGLDWKVTWESAVKFIEQAKDKPYKIMAVPQSVEGDWKGWMECYDKMMKEPKIEMIGMSILGIPNAFCSLTGTKDIAFNRIFASAYIIANTGHMPGTKWHHYLGLGAGPRELIIQQQIGLIDSNDSSSPIWHGHLGIMYDNSQSGLKDGKSKIPVNFGVKPSSKNMWIQYNIDYMSSILST